MVPCYEEEQGCSTAVRSKLPPYAAALISMGLENWLQGFDGDDAVAADHLKDQGFKEWVSRAMFDVIFKGRQHGSTCLPSTRQPGPWPLCMQMCEIVRAYMQPLPPYVRTFAACHTICLGCVGLQMPQPYAPATAAPLAAFSDLSRAATSCAHVTICPCVASTDFVRTLTTMPMSCLSFMSTVLSSTQFMNWSNPRSVPVTCRLAFSVTVGGRARAASGVAGKMACVRQAHCMHMPPLDAGRWCWQLARSEAQKTTRNMKMLCMRPARTSLPCSNTCNTAVGACTLLPTHCSVSCP